MRASSLTVTTLALALAFGSAHADFILAFDDPTTPEIDFPVHDEGPRDFAKGQPGYINFIGEAPVGGATVVTAGVTATSDPVTGSVSSPRLLLNVNLLRTTGNPLNILVTDTDFTSSLTGGRAIIDGAAEGVGAIQFDYYGGTGNAQFGRSFTITSTGVIPVPVDGRQELTGPADPVGSLTIDVIMDGEFDINTAFITTLELE